MYNIPNIFVDLSEYGKQELDFQSVIQITEDLGSELHKEPALYAYFDFVACTLEKRYEQRKVALENYAAILREDVQETLGRKSDKKPTVKDIEAAMQTDEKLLRLAEEQVELHSQIKRVRGFLIALTHKHSNLKELSRREIAGLIAENTEVKPDEVKLEPRGSKLKRGRKQEETNA